MWVRVCVRAGVCPCVHVRMRVCARAYVRVGLLSCLRACECEFLNVYLYAWF